MSELGRCLVLLRLSLDENCLQIEIILPVRTITMMRHESINQSYFYSGLSNEQLLQGPECKDSLHSLHS